MLRGLKCFPRFDFLGDPELALTCSGVEKVVCCSLGPEGTNIAQASRRWLRRLGIEYKSEVRLGDTPEICLKMAREVQEDGVVAVFWTCAVYAKEAQLFFGNPDVYPFLFREEMKLDEMQLAAKPEMARRIQEEGFHQDWTVASHPSPVHLVKDLGCKIYTVNSNAVAAHVCAEGGAEACITTGTARDIYGLHTLHSFGSPIMVFFGGVTQHGMDVLMAAQDCAH